MKIKSYFDFFKEKNPKLTYDDFVKFFNQECKIPLTNTDKALYVIKNIEENKNYTQEISPLGNDIFYDDKILFKEKIDDGLTYHLLNKLFTTFIDGEEKISFPNAHERRFKIV